MAEDTKALITVGEIVNTQGNRGEVRVLPLTDFPERFKNMKKVRLQKDGRIDYYLIEKVYAHKKFMVFKFAGVNDMDIAETLKGALIMVTREELMPLPEHTYYIFDLIDLKVFNQTGRFLGQVTDVLQTGANDVYVVEGVSERPLLIPALKSVVQKIDLKEGQMIVELLEGLEE